jgi:DNA-damage-inducible protein D
MPKTIPPAEHIKQVEKRLKGRTPKLQLDDKDAVALLGKPDE